MTALQLAELNGLLALAVERGTDRAQGRDPDKVADEVLASIHAPDLGATIKRLTAMLVI